jgi:DNA-binding protein H-NS
MSKSATKNVSLAPEISVEEQLEINRKIREGIDAQDRKLIKTAKKNALSTIADLFIKYQLNIDEVQTEILEVGMKKAKTKSSPKEKTVKPPKYRNPLDHSQTWNGMGNPPKWGKVHKENGTLESTRIPVM